MTSGIDQLSLLARPAGARSSDAAAATATPKSGEIGLGAGRVDPAIVERVEVVVDHFRRPGQVARIVLVPGSRHHGSARRRPTGNTIDFRIDGVKSEALAAFCKTLPETACRYASNGPSGAFVHMGVTAVNASRATEADRPEPTESASTESASPADDTTSTSTPPAAMMVQSAGSTAAPERQGKLPALPSRERPARHRPRAVKAHTEQYFL